MVFVLKGHGRQHGAEHFLLRKAVAYRYIAQQGGGLVVAGLGGFVHHHALGHHGDAGHLGVRQKIPHALLLRLADQRAHVQVHGGGAHAQGLEGLAQALQQGLVNQ
ncbi:hypothetical protein D3C71_1405390 [compost metagenome]